jgi:hypothetical protein
MAVVARIESVAADDRRSENRRRIHLESALAGSGDEVLIHDISETGLLLETGSPLEPFETLHFNLPEAGATEAVVVWNSGHYFGCEFTRPLSKAAISAAMLRGPIARAPIAEAASANDAELDMGSENEAQSGELSFAVKMRVILGANLALWMLILWALGVF